MTPINITLRYLLLQDRKFVRRIEKELRQFHPWAAEALEEAADMFPMFLAISNKSEKQFEDQIILERRAQDLGIPFNELEKRLQSGKSDSALAIVRPAWIAYRAREISKTLVILCQKQFRWAATDLMRGRVTSAIGHTRLQIESVSLMNLFKDKPERAHEWFAAQDETSGMDFFKATRKDLEKVRKKLQLNEAYKRASGQAQHVRMSTLLFSYHITHHSDTGSRLYTPDNEFNPSDALRYLDAFLALLITQGRVFDAITQAFEVHNPLWRVRVTRFRIRVTDLVKELVRQYPDQTQTIRVTP